MAYIRTDTGAPPTRRRLSFLPFDSRLKDGTRVELVRVLPEIRRNDQSTTHILQVLRNLLNYELVVRGDSYPFPPRDLTMDQFLEYYAAHELFVLLRKDRGGSLPACVARDPLTQREYFFGSAVVGSFYIKPNYPHRSAHICNAGFLVVPEYRGRCGAGTLMARCFIVLAEELGYHASVFNLVYATNVASMRIWEKLGFVKLSVIPRGGLIVVRRHPDSHEPVEEYVDAVQYYADVRTMAPAMREVLRCEAAPLWSAAKL